MLDSHRDVLIHGLMFRPYPQPRERKPPTRTTPRAAALYLSRVLGTAIYRNSKPGCHGLTVTRDASKLRSPLSANPGLLKTEHTTCPATGPSQNIKNQISTRLIPG